MKIGIVTQKYHPLVGGVETHTRQLAHGLSVRHDVRVAATNFAACRLPARLRAFESDLLAPAHNDFHDNAVPVHAIAPRRGDRLWMLPMALMALPRVQRYAYDKARAFAYRFYRRVFVERLVSTLAGTDVVHCMGGGYLGWASQEVARAMRLPFVCTPFVHPGQWGDSPLDVEYYLRCDRLIALLPTDKEYLVSLGIPRERIRVIGVSPDSPASVDPASFRARHGLAGAPIILYLRRMMPRKGSRAILAAASRVWEKFPEARFVFAGPASGPEPLQFRNADPRISYLGKLGWQEKGDALAACDIFCMPSTSEILPTVYLEAWSYGKPVVGGTAPGLRELVEGNGAGLVADQEPRRLAESLVRLLSDADLRRRLGRRGRRLVESRYSVEAVTDQIESLYRCLLMPAGHENRAPAFV